VAHLWFGVDPPNQLQQTECGDNQKWQRDDDSKEQYLVRDGLAGHPTPLDKRSVFVHGSTAGLHSSVAFRYVV
jgi:hypothetical protein